MFQLGIKKKKKKEIVEREKKGPTVGYKTKTSFPTVEFYTETKCRHNHYTNIR